MKNALMGSVFLLTLAASSRAEASFLYTTTDLGSSYQLLAGAGGNDYGVTGSLGVTYAFDKTPIAHINIQSVSSDGTSWQTLTLQDGGFQVGYAMAQGQSGWTTYASFTGYNGGWFGSASNVVSDMNVQGQVVGTSSIYGSNKSYAAFSAVGVQSHNDLSGSPIVDNLNNYIATIPGVSLTSAVAIDDLGRIVVGGSNGDAYLLTPTSLGSPATVPEPSTVCLLGLAATIMGFRALGRRKGHSKAKAE